MTIKKCPECGRDFPAYPEHALHNEYGEDVCSPSCSTAGWKRAQQRIDEEMAKEDEYIEIYNDKKRKRYVRAHNRKEVQLVDMDGNVIAEYKSIHAASCKTGWSHSTVQRVCDGLTWIDVDYKFRYADPKLRKPYAPPKKPDQSHRFVPIVQLDQDGQIVARHISLKVAASAVGCNASAISNCCSGNLKHVKGFVFMRERDYEKLCKREE